MKRLSVSQLVEGALMIALATVLSFVKIYQAPQGGSVTAASMLPIILFALRHGWKKGCAIGAVYGILQLILDNYIFHPVQVILDYPLAFAMLGLAGFASDQLKGEEHPLKKLFLPIFLAISARGLCHIISGVVFFSEYAGDKNPLLYSFSYNMSYLAIEFVITFVILSQIWAPLDKLLKDR